MSRAVSIHIGVNAAGGSRARRVLRYSEYVAWRMAGLAHRAGYQALTVLRGETATRAAVNDAITRAAGELVSGDHLLVSFSGHGAQERDTDRDDGNGWDEGWCLSDGVLVDDQLGGYWRLFQRGVRIVVVADSCYSAGTGRDGEDTGGVKTDRDRVKTYRDGGEGERGVRPATRTMRGGLSVFRGPAETSAAAAAYDPKRYLVECPHEAHGIHASLLLLSSCGEGQEAQETLFTRHLLDVWNRGEFGGSYGDLYETVRSRVMGERSDQRPHIVRLGAIDPEFVEAPAFHLDRRGGHTDPGVYDGFGGDDDEDFEDFDRRSGNGERDGRPPIRYR